MVRLIPNAKLSSLPLNHRAMAVVTATMSDSAPSPKIRRPATIDASTRDSTSKPKMDPSHDTSAARGANAGRSGQAVTAAPRKQIAPNSRVERLVPMRSMMIPPIRTITMLGKL